MAVIDVTTRGAIFDVDGTLVLSNAAHAAAWSRAFAECGFFDVPPARVRPLIGMGGDDLIARLKPDLDESTKTETIERHKKIFKRDYLKRLRPAPGAHELACELATRGIKLIVATSAKEDELQPLLAVAGVDGIITEWITSDDVERAKPAADMVQAALARMQLAASDAVMVGDTIYDIEAAHRAGVRIIAFRCGGSPEQLLAAADAVFDDPLQLVTALRQSSSPNVRKEVRAVR
ncbi:MAG: HAD family hydrolase [Candidatus Eremiobacteraeota bacterium]|nr:HAD family hydrolase [Candidatus Eremiobacteraeota bacterium]